MTWTMFWTVYAIIGVVVSSIMHEKLDGSKYREMVVLLSRILIVISWPHSLGVILGNLL